MPDLDLPTPKAFLVDLDGVIYIQGELIPGAIDTIAMLKERSVPHRFVTNTTIISRRQLLERVRKVGLKIDINELFTAPLATAGYLRNLPDAKCYFYTTPAVIEDFPGITRVETQPTHVIIGEVGDQFSYANMNRVFRMIMDGAEIVAFQKNRYWLTKDGLTLDAGAFVAALEFATGRIASVFGKPSPKFFHQACSDLGLPPTDVAMIGDDLKVDIAGAATAGLKTIFVRTGKDREVSVNDAERKPNVVLESIADLQELIRSAHS